MPITINEDTTFLISDEVGDVPAGAEFGLYDEDTRFLSRYELTLDGRAPLLLAARATGAAAAVHVLTNPALPAVPRGQLGIVRQRLVGPGMREDLAITNHGDRDAALTLELRFDADFAHVFEVKRSIEVEQEAVERKGAAPEVGEDGRSLRFRSERSNLGRRLVVTFARQPEVAADRCRFALRLARRESWHLGLDAIPFAEEASAAPGAAAGGNRRREAREHRHHREVELVQGAPGLETDGDVLRRGYAQSVRDFAALCIKGEAVAEGEFVIAAGIPWFMALFGRDALIAAYQALPFYPERAKGVLRALARLQGIRVDPVRAEEPGKILHEHRFGTPTGTRRPIPAFPYYGSIDATPLFLILLAAVFRVTGDLDFVRSLHANALRALDWMERSGDRDGDGYLEYLREGEVGLENQGWKDSFDAIRFRDGTIARPPIALCEVQGYAFAARLGIADVLDALGEPERAAELRAAAAALKQRVNRDFWLPDRGSYALALDADKRPVDALTSNPGHLLWTGIADDDKARLVAERLLGPELFSGWGVRTMATTEGGYNPISYHNGSVWPHDNGLIVAGLARYGFTGHAARVVDGLLAALDRYADDRLPELFAGYGREEAPFPVEYPTANRPQAWAAGSVFLLLAAMLGLDVDAGTLREERAFLPPGVNRVRLEGLWVDRRRAVVEATRTGERIRVRLAGDDAAQIHDEDG